MDTSVEYIKMCEKAVEVQKLWKPTGGDWYLHDYRGTTRTSPEFEKQIWGDDNSTWQAVEILCYRPSEARNVFISTHDGESRIVAESDLIREHCIWLPRQDQLQEMDAIVMTPLSLRGVHPRIGGLERGFIDFPEWLAYVYGRNYGNKPNGHLHIFNSWEQLWLAYVMKEEYRKLWDGKDWV